MCFGVRGGDVVHALCRKLAVSSVGRWRYSHRLNSFYSLVNVGYYTVSFVAID